MRGCDMERQRAGLGAGANSPPVPLSPEALVPCSGLPQAPSPCVHTQADSQQRQEEQLPLTPVHGVTALRGDRSGTAAPRSEAERCRLWSHVTAHTPTPVSPARLAQPHSCLTTALSAVRGWTKCQARVTWAGEETEGPVCPNRDGPASIPPQAQLSQIHVQQGS